MNTSVHAAARTVLMTADPARKCELTAALLDDWSAGRVSCCLGTDDHDAVWAPGRPSCPELVPPQDLPRRRVSTPAGHAALLHAIAHIEFNAINLALDCVMRFKSFPDDFHQGWLEVAADEARHFGMLRARLGSLGFDYGDFPAHNGLWEMACRTADDPLARMALVPRVLEARGLDATPPIMEKLRGIGDVESVAILEVILHDEISHVALGDRWFRRLCGDLGLEPEAMYLELIDGFSAPWPSPPLHEKARLEAGFSPGELKVLSSGPIRRTGENR